MVGGERGLVGIGDNGMVPLLGRDRNKGGDRSPFSTTSSNAGTGIREVVVVEVLMMFGVRNWDEEEMGNLRDKFASLSVF